MYKYNYLESKSRGPLLPDVGFGVTIDPKLYRISAINSMASFIIPLLWKMHQRTYSAWAYTVGGPLKDQKAKLSKMWTELELIATMVEAIEKEDIADSSECLQSPNWTLHSEPFLQTCSSCKSTTPLQRKSKKVCRTFSWIDFLWQNYSVSPLFHFQIPCQFLFFYL